ncbi:MAG TPA: twin-arginine translocase subunit TatC [Pyrinomonadaceae bacterium]|nr:twin-arginine translocase subunit TatC [Pyrinomonadaceae bacterium]
MNDKLVDELELRGGQMSFLEHLDELRKRLVNSVIIIIVAFCACWYFSGVIFNFLSVPIREALSEASRRDVPLKGLSGDEKIAELSTLKVGDHGRYVFDSPARFGTGVVEAGTSVESVVAAGADGKPGLFTEEAIITNNSVIPAGVQLPVDLSGSTTATNPDERLIVTTAAESFTLFVTVSLYAAIAFSIPLLLWQVWAFISPALYKHERAYVWPFVILSSVSFVGGAAFAYYILLPPALNYLLGLGEDFRLLLRATDYFDFVTIVLLAMGLIFQMPAITYVLARIGIVSAGFLVRIWKIAIIVILIVAAVVSPTGDIPNMMLFAAPMFVLYIVSIFIAWFFGRKRRPEATI